MNAITAPNHDLARFMEQVTGIERSCPIVGSRHRRLDTAMRELLWCPCLLGAEQNRRA